MRDRRAAFSCAIALIGAAYTSEEVVAQQTGLADYLRRQTEERQLWSVVRPDRSELVGMYCDLPWTSKAFVDALPKDGDRLAVRSRTPVRVWHVHVLIKQEPVLGMSPEFCPGTLGDLLIDADGFIVGYRHPNQYDFRMGGGLFRELAWQRADIADESQYSGVPLQRLATALTDPARLLTESLASNLRGSAVEKRIIDDLANYTRQCVRIVEFAPDEMTRFDISATRVVETSIAATIVEVTPFVALVDADHDVQLLGVGTSETRIVAQQRSLAINRSSNSADLGSARESAIRGKLHQVADGIGPAIARIPAAFVAEQKTFYLAREVTTTLEATRQKLVDSLEDAPALRDTVKQVLDEQLPLNTWRVSLSGHDIVLVSDVPVSVVADEELKEAVKALQKLIAHILSFESLQPDVRCMSYPTGARLVIRVGSSESSERFTDTNGTLERLWRGVYSGKAVILSGGFKSADVKLDIFNQKSASIVCNFAPLHSANESTCVQARGE